jgi:hypothetical protein
LTLTASRFENNTAANGGALFLRFENGDASSTFRTNRTTSTTDGWGGAILPWGADVTIADSALEGNRPATAAPFTIVSPPPAWR